MVNDHCFDGDCFWVALEDGSIDYSDIAADM